MKVIIAIRNELIECEYVVHKCSFKFRLSVGSLSDGFLVFLLSYETVCITDSSIKERTSVLSEAHCQVDEPTLVTFR